MFTSLIPSYKSFNIRYLKIFIYSFCLLFCSTAFGQDLSLEKALKQALENNYGIVISRLENEQSKIQNHWGNTGLLPSIGLSAGSNNNYNIDASSLSGNTYADLGLNWTFFNGFRAVSIKQKLDELSNLSDGQLDVLVENTIEEVIMGYFSVLYENEKLNVFETIFKLSQDRYRYEEKRHELGSAVTYEMLQAKNSFLSDQVAFMEQELSVRNSMRQLNYLMGIDSLATWQMSTPFNADTLHYDFAQLKDLVLSGNNRLENQYIQLKVKQLDRRIEQSNLYPDLMLSTGVNHYSPYADNSASSALKAYGNIGLSYNIFNGGQRKRAIQIAKINEDIGLMEINELKHIIINQFNNAFDLYEVRIEILKVAEENLATAELNLEIAEQKYKSGAINSFNYRDIQLIYLQTATSRYQAIFNLVNAHTALVRLTGGLLESK